MDGTLLFLVDVDNLFHSAKLAYGDAARVDFHVLKNAVCNIPNVTWNKQLSIAYKSVKPGGSQDGFLQALSYIGYTIRTTLCMVSADGEYYHTDMDVSLAVDAVTTLFSGKHPDRIYIASGDQDFLPAYQFLRMQGCYVGAVSFEISLARDVKNYVDEVIYLDASHLYAEKEVS